ncbi:pentatricopeptide repeat-containing protein At2g02980, chloroplastic-like [Bidens hawaiensis]|uniref:pentatricopeptide repeat-containing protein At2g02980, chloroplastic-like n=1 Tax=Bidens hawaiensis TaxID=980011 RepID=UPI00404A09F5
MRVLHQIHSHIITRSSSSFSLSKLISFCALSPLGNIQYAQRLLFHTPNPNIFSYNSLIRAFSQSQSFSLFKTLISRGHPTPNTYTLAFVLKSCSNYSIHQGCQVHSRVIRSGFSSNSFLHSSLVTFYAKCERIEYARKVFDEMPERSLVAWSAMIGGYARLGLCDEALGLFSDMQKAGVVPDEVTMASVVSACGGLGALDVGRWVHAYVKKRKIVVDVKLSTALINMYAKCGCVEEAKEVFDEMPVKDSRAWSSMIVGFAIHGLAENALSVFARMEEAKVKPNHVAFLGVLQACAHGQLVNEGQRHWANLLESGIQPSIEHYSCMVDLFCRANLFQQAYTFIKNMPVDPDPVIWRTFLVACKKNKDIEKGELVGQQLLSLEPLNPDNYALLSSLYAACSQWSKMGHLRKQMKENGLKTVPGCSSIELDGTVHEFVLGDWSHPESKDIKEALSDIMRRVELSGHKPDGSGVLHDVGDEVKEEALCEHSERLAMAYGLMKTRAPVVIRVVKNLRVCGDCHEVTKIISRVYEREIVVRDRVRFHRFVGGACSCKDIW